ncbi:YqjF family protein [Flavitalea antarctica]
MIKKSKFLTAEWRKLIMANYAVDASVLQKFLPFKTVLDSFEGKHYVSLVGFMFQNTRMLNLSIPFHTDFPEINLRFYVKFKDGDTWKRGVVFLKEIVPKPAISFVANLIYKENYVSLPVRHSEEFNEDKLKVSYEWKFRNQWHKLAVNTSSLPVALVPGSQEEFITEHFWGYAKINGQSTGEYEVEHPRWEIYPVTDYNIRCNFKELYGAQFAGLDAMEPESVFLAEGSKISVYKKRLITETG